MTTYSEADLGLHQRVKALINAEASFRDLEEAAVTVMVMIAHNPDGPAVKMHGVAASAKIKVNSLADRAEGKLDATITLDAEVWANKSERAQEALLWHELTHLVVVRDKETDAIKRDDTGRPKLRTRPDDYFLNGFYECAQKYGQDSPECSSLMSIVGEYRQLGLWNDWEQPAPRANSRARSAASH